MATDNVTENLVKFAYGTKANYSAERHAQYVYFATDTPLIHTKGMWRGVSGVKLDGYKLKITTAEKDSDNNNTVATEVKVDLTSIACTATQRSQWTTAYNFVNSIMGTDQDSVINKWQEVVDFLAGIQDITLTEIMDTKADKATKVFGSNDIKITKTNASGIVQEGDPTLGSSFKVSIDHQCTTGANTYLKVTVDDTGFVNSGVTSLVESDIPTLSIGKISGLQAALNDKLTGSSEIGTLPPLSGGGPINEEPTISLNYDGTTLVLGSGNKLKVASAPKLSTARSLWGNSFDGTKNVSGDLEFVASGQTSQSSHGMRIGSTLGGFIGFSKVMGMDGVGNFTGISLGWGAKPETDAASVRINDSIFTYKGNPIYYKGSTDFTDGVRAIIAPELTSIANDFIAIGNRVTAVEKQLKWIEVS